MSKIVAFYGKKGAGKNTLCNFLHGYQLKCYNVIDAFELTEKGELIIDTLVKDETGTEQKGKGLIDITRYDMDFGMWAVDNVWPFIKHYSFAGTLKDICLELFNIEREKLFGTDEQKNSPTQYKWEDMPVKIKGKSGFITGREFMQYFGTEICRSIYPSIWADKIAKDIESEQSNISVISDCRFKNEAEAVKKMGGKVIKLTRNVYGNDNHSSENDLNDFEDFDAIIDNANLSIHESCIELLKIIDEWGWVAKTVAPSRNNVTSIK